ncbi:MAG: GNAT family N-acetyltransferase [Anaerolineae bacterium]|nr:GNAT family N-acetyltransferase [Anaerolineae bacterium]
MASSLPQLRMGFTRFDQLLPPQPVPGYGLRTFRPGDEDDWLALLRTEEAWEWDRARLDWMLAGGRGFMPPSGIFFATKDDRPVAAACTFLYPDEAPPAGELGWVITHPGHRRRGLALQVCRAVLGYIRNSGYSYAFLKTEDFRTAAVKMYLQIGFEPEMVHPGHPAWWAALHQSLANEAREGAGGSLPKAKRSGQRSDDP